MGSNVGSLGCRWRPLALASAQATPSGLFCQTGPADLNMSSYSAGSTDPGPSPNTTSVHCVGTIGSAWGSNGLTV